MVQLVKSVVILLRNGGVRFQVAKFLKANNKSQNGFEHFQSNEATPVLFGSARRASAERMDGRTGERAGGSVVGRASGRACGLVSGAGDRRADGW